jgi:hypothetical protein
MAKASTKNKPKRGWFSPSPQRSFLLSKGYSRVAPFTGTGKFEVNYNSKGYTVKGPVNQEMIRVANGTHEPKFWEEVISKWRAFPASKRTGRNADKNLRALIRREHNKTYGPKTVYKTRAAKAPEYTSEFKKISEELAALKKKDKVPVKAPEQVVVTSVPLPQRSVEVPMAMASDVAIERMKTQDVYGRPLENTPETVASELNLPSEVAEQFEQVRTRQMSQSSLDPSDIPLFGEYTRRVQGSMRSGVTGAAS